MRVKKQELQLQKGISSVNAIADIDFYYGPFVSMIEAFSTVTDNLREVGRRVAIYKDSTKRDADLYIWIKNEDSQWLLRNISDAGEGGSSSDLPNAILEIGEISIDNNIVTIETPASGLIRVRINNTIFTKDKSTKFTIDEITNTNFRRDLIEARPENGLFFYKKGVEGSNPITPTLTNGALYVTEVLVTPSGINVGQPVDTSGLKQKSEDNWKSNFSNKLSVYSLTYYDERTCHTLDTLAPSTLSSTLKGIFFASEISRDVMFTIKNNTLGVCTLISVETNNLFKGFTADHLPFELLPKYTVFVKYNHEIDALEIIKTVSAGGISNIFTTGVITGDGTSSAPIDVSPATSSQRGTQSAAHYNKLESINLATQTEVENQSAPSSESNRYISIFSLWKWLQNLSYVILKPNLTTAIANRLRSDGSNLYFANGSAIESKILYDNEGYISVTGDVTLDNSYHGRIVRISANCNITLSSTLRNDFIAYFVVIGNYTITFVEGSGVTFYAPYGKKMLEGNTCYAQKSSGTKFDLIGTLTPA